MLTIKNRAAKSITLFAAAVILFAGCSPPGPRALLAGKKLLDKGKYEPAMAELKRAATLLGTNALAFSYLGLACHQAGHLPDAERAYERALALDPDLVEVRYNLGCLWLSENKFDPAKTALTAYTLRRPGSADGWLKLGTAQLRSGQAAPTYLRAGELTAAERSFNEAIRLSPQNPEALTGLGLARLQRNRPADAAQYFTRALKVQADYRPALLNLAIVAQQNMNDRSLAAQKYREYLALKPVPENAAAVGAIIKQLEQEAAPPPARAAVTNLAAQSSPAVSTAKPPAPESIHIVGSANIPATNLTHTVAATPKETALVGTRPMPVTNSPKPVPANSAPPTNIEVSRVPAEPVIRAAGDDIATSAAVPNVEHPAGVTPAPATVAQTNEAKRSLLQRMNPLNLLASQPKTQARSTPPATNTVMANEDAAAVSLEAGSSALPRYRYQSPPKLTPGDRSGAERAFAQGVQAHQSRQWAEAQQAYRRAVQADPSFFDAWYNLGLAATEAGNLPVALSAYEAGLALRPDSLDARYNFALVLKQANYPVDAARELEKLLVSYPNDSRAHLALGNLYAQQLHQPAKARTHYVKVLQTDPQNPQAGAIRYWLTDTAH